MNLVGTRFRDVPILAEEATHVAAGCSHREDLCAGQKMVQRLLFDRVNLNGGRRGVTEAVELSSVVHANEAETCLTISDMAVPRAEVAMRLAARFGFPPAGFVQRLGFLKDFKILHRVVPGTVP